MLPDETRARVAELISAHRASLAGLSRMLGRGEGYMSDYLNRKVPYDLAAADRGRLARFFGVDPEALKPQQRRPGLSGLFNEPKRRSLGGR
jgi:hypothetical protein